MKINPKDKDHNNIKIGLCYVGQWILTYSFIAFLLLVLILPSAHASFSSSNAGGINNSYQNGPGVARKSHKKNILNSKQYQLSGGSYVPEGVVPPSPECWKSAVFLLDMFQQEQPSSNKNQKHDQPKEDAYVSATFASNNRNAAELCTLMPHNLQKRFALEIAKCHVNDLGKHLLKETNDENANEKCANDLQFCLHNLSDAGVDAYTHYVSYVQQLCIRLTTEMFLSQQHSTQQKIAADYANLSVQAISQLGNLEELTRNHSNQMKALSMLPNQIKDDLTESLTFEIKNHFEHYLRSLEEKTFEQAQFITHMLDSFETREKEHQKMVEFWLQEQTNEWGKQAHEIQRQNKWIEESKTKLEELSHIVAQTSTNMKPLMAIEYLMKAIAHSYSWLEMAVNSLSICVVLWILTYPKYCWSFRKYVFGLAFFTAAVEACLMGLYHQHLVCSQVRDELIPYVRGVGIVLICFCYFIGLVSSILSVSRKRNEINNVNTTNFAFHQEQNAMDDHHWQMMQHYYEQQRCNSSRKEGNALVGWKDNKWQKQREEDPFSLTTYVGDADLTVNRNNRPQSLRRISVTPNHHHCSFDYPQHHQEQEKPSVRTHDSYWKIDQADQEYQNLQQRNEITSIISQCNGNSCDSSEEERKEDFRPGECPPFSCLNETKSKRTTRERKRSRKATEETDSKEKFIPYKQEHQGECGGEQEPHDEEKDHRRRKSRRVQSRTNSKNKKS